MMQEEVNVVKVGSALGTRIDPELAKEFQDSYGHFASEYDPESEDAKRRLGEMVSLLEVNEKNLKEVQSQGWFKRAWASVSGRNRGLARVNEANLVKVQAGSVYFLERLAAQSQISMRSVAFALKRLEDLQISNEKLKGYLLRAVDGYNRRLDIVEDEIQDHGIRIEELEGSVRRWPRYVASAALIAIGLMAAVIPLFRDRNLLWAAPGAVVCIGGLLLLTRRHTVQEGSLKSSGDRALQSDREATQAMALRNAEAARKLRDWAAQEFKEHLSEAYEDIFEPFGEFYNSIPDPQEGDPSSKEVAVWLDAWLNASPRVGDRIHTQCGQVADQVCSAINSWMSALLQEAHVKDQAGIELRIHLGHEHIGSLRSSFESAIDPMRRTLGDLEKQRQALLSAYPRFRKLLVEHPAKAGARNFMKGFLLVPLLFDDEQEFTGAFYQNFSDYGQGVDNLKNQLIQSVDPLIAKQLDSFFESAAARLEVLGRLFTEEKLELQNMIDN